MSIQRSKLETLNWAAFTTSDHVEEYERRLCSNGGQLLGERERWQLNRGWVNDTIRLFDMSGISGNPMTGAGYIEEISVLLQREVDAGRQLRTVIVDSASGMCRRYVEGKSGPTTSLRKFHFLLETLGRSLQRDIAARYRCTVWLIHRVRSDLGSAPPTRLMHHADCEHSRQLPVHMSVVGCLGTTDGETRCARINWSKIRYMDGRWAPPRIVQIDDKLSRMYDVSSQYTADELTKRIVPRFLAD